MVREGCGHRLKRSPARLHKPQRESLHAKNATRDDWLLRQLSKLSISGPVANLNTTPLPALYVHSLPKLWSVTKLFVAMAPDLLYREIFATLSATMQEPGANRHTARLDLQWSTTALGRDTWARLLQIRW